jgi:hypothetical protein
MFIILLSYIHDFIRLQYGLWTLNFAFTLARYCLNTKLRFMNMKLRFMNMKLRFHAQTKTFSVSLIPQSRRHVPERCRASLLFSEGLDPVFSQPDRAGLQTRKTPPQMEESPRSGRARLFQRSIGAPILFNISILKANHATSPKFCPVDKAAFGGVDWQSATAADWRFTGHST